MTKRLFHSLSMILLCGVSACAGQPINVQIPFTFHVGNSVLPAGTYRADTDVAEGVLRMRSNDGKNNVMILANRVQSKATTGRSKLVFHRYADQFFLYQVWSAGSSMGRELPKSRSEIEVASAGSRGVQTVLARR